jgi:protein-tyrosine phosphatase
MGEKHRELVLDEAPSVHRRTLGILDLAAALVEVSRTYTWPDLLADAGAKEVRARWRILPELLLAVGAMPTKVTEVDDPYGRGPDAFDRMSAQLDDAVRTIVYWEAQFPR